METWAIQRRLPTQPPSLQPTLRAAPAGSRRAAAWFSRPGGGLGDTVIIGPRDGFTSIGSAAARC
jgi:hypothetical protein